MPAPISSGPRRAPVPPPSLDAGRDFEENGARPTGNRQGCEQGVLPPRLILFGRRNEEESMKADIELVKRCFSEDNYARSLGIVPDSLTENAIEMHMELREEMLNLFQRFHGGAIYSLADAAFSVPGNNSNNLAVALDCSITYHASPEAGTTLVVLGETLSTTARTGAYLFRVFMEKDGGRSLISTMKSVSSRTGKPLDTGRGQ
jgi:uncharacterized protein (TIGR00369 family)